jgi:hypothetical protein
MSAIMQIRRRNGRRTVLQRRHPRIAVIGSHAHGTRDLQAGKSVGNITSLTHVVMLSSGGTDGVGTLRFKGTAGVMEPATPAVAMVVDEPEAIRLALSGFGMALVPEFLISTHLCEGHLQLAWPGYHFVGEPAELGVGFMRRRTVPRRARDFIDACVTHFGRSGTVSARAMDLVT